MWGDYSGTEVSKAQLMLKEKHVLNCFAESGPKSSYLSLHHASEPQAPLREQLGVM